MKKFQAISLRERYNNRKPFSKAIEEQMKAYNWKLQRVHPRTGRPSGINSAVWVFRYRGDETDEAVKFARNQRLRGDSPDPLFKVDSKEIKDARE